MTEKKSKNYISDSNLQTYFREISQYELLTYEDELDCSRRIEKGQKEALNKLINANLRMVVTIARKYANREMSLLDMIQEGNYGLVKAARKYDYREKVRFSTYAYCWIKQAIKSAVKKNSFPKGSKKTLKSQPSVVSLYTELNQDRIAVIDAIPDQSYNPPDEEFVEGHVKEDTHRFLNVLREKEKKILMYRFALTGDKKHTLRSIGEKMGISPEGVRQIEIRALQKLRFKAHPMRSYFYK